MSVSDENPFNPTDFVYDFAEDDLEDDLERSNSPNHVSNSSLELERLMDNTEKEKQLQQFIKEFETVLIKCRENTEMSSNSVPPKKRRNNQQNISGSSAFNPVPVDIRI